MREEKQTCLEMMVGIIGSTILIAIVGAIFAPNKGTFVLGVVLGGILAIGILMQLYRSIDKSLAMDERSAEKYAVRSSMIRLLFMGIALVIGLLLPNIFNVVGILLGLLGLKICAYTQPLVHVVLAKKVQ